MRIERSIASDAAGGEYIGVARFSPRGAQQLRAYYHRARAAHAGAVWRDGAPFEKAYLIHLFQFMIEDGVDVHMVTTDGEYMEIDTEEDYALANARWPREYGV